MNHNPIFIFIPGKKSQIVYIIIPKKQNTFTTLIQKNQCENVIPNRLNHIKKYILNMSWPHWPTYETNSISLSFTSFPDLDGTLELIVSRYGFLPRIPL